MELEEKGMWEWKSGRVRCVESDGVAGYKLGDVLTPIGIDRPNTKLNKVRAVRQLNSRSVLSLY